ncbi:protein FAM161A [Rhynchocyon petersi]
MDPSHRAAKLVASSYHPPINPNTGAPVAHYEREDLIKALAAAAAAAALKEAAAERRQEAVRPARASADFKTNSSGMDGHKNTSLEDTVDLSDIYHSNAEYFRKLEELKAAHVETMAKLQSLYKNKLNLKGVQPVIIREDTSTVFSRFASEKNSNPPVSLEPSLSEADLGPSSSVSAASSEDELPDPETEYRSKSRMMTFAEALINNMWKDFSVEDYIQSDETDLSSVVKRRKKPKQWVPKITVPEPFQMTVREQKKKGESLKSRSVLELEHRLLKKQEEEEAECRKKFRANPVPASVFLPLYHELVKQNEERRRALKEKSREALLASQKPFKFLVREEQKRATQDKLKDFFKPKQKTNRFKARPLPQSVCDPTVSDRLKEEELIRKMRTQMKARELVQKASSQPAHRSVAATRTPSHPTKSQCKRKAKSQTPDVENVPDRYIEYLSEDKYSEGSAPHELLDLQESSQSLPKKENILADIRADENVKEADWSPWSPRHKPTGKSASPKPAPCVSNPPRSTVSSRERERAIRRSLEEKKMLEEERNRILTKRKQRMKELQKLLATRAKAYDSHESLAQMFKSRIKSLRRSEKERMREYHQELEEREEKLKKRPLLFERVAQKNARMAAEKHYSNTLKALGICEEFVSKKGQSGKMLEELSNQEMKSFTADKESFNEEIIEERENGEENDFLDTNSQDSCKENDELSDEAGEENSAGEES